MSNDNEKEELEQLVEAQQKLIEIYEETIRTQHSLVTHLIKLLKSKPKVS